MIILQLFYKKTIVCHKKHYLNMIPLPHQSTLTKRDLRAFIIFSYKRLSATFTLVDG